MSAMRRIILTAVCSLALVLTIGFGVSAASNGRGIGVLLHPNDTSAKSGNDPAHKAHKEFTGTPFEFDPEHTGIVPAARVKPPPPPPPSPINPPRRPPSTNPPPP